MATIKFSSLFDTFTDVEKEYAEYLLYGPTLKKEEEYARWEPDIFALRANKDITRWVGDQKFKRHKRKDYILDNFDLDEHVKLIKYARGIIARVAKGEKVSADQKYAAYFLLRPINATLTAIGVESASSLSIGESTASGPGLIINLGND